MISKKYSTKASRAAARKRKSKKKEETSYPMYNDIDLQDFPQNNTLNFTTLPQDIQIDDHFTLDEEYIWDREGSKEIDKFINEFSYFQYNNNIGDVSENMNPEKWIEVDTFIFKYMFQLACENKFNKVIQEYGIADSMINLFNFYKKDLCIDFMQQDSEILEYISKQTSGSINADMTLAILRESIGFTSYKRFM